MEKYESKIVAVSASSEAVFNKLSNLENLRPMVDVLLQHEQAQGKVRDISLTADSCSFNVDMAGDIAFSIIEREEFKTIKFASDKSPVGFNLWIQLVEKDAYDTRMRLTLHADIPFMLKMMVKSKLQDGLDKAAEALAKIQY